MFWYFLHLYWKSILNDNVKAFWFSYHNYVSNFFGITFTSAFSMSLKDDPVWSEELGLASWNMCGHESGYILQASVSAPSQPLPPESSLPPTFMVAKL